MSKQASAPAIFYRAQQYGQVIEAIFRAKQIHGRAAKVRRGARFISYDVLLGNPLDLDKALKLADNMALFAGCENVMVQRDHGVLRFDFQLRRSHWQYYDRSHVTGLQIGLAPGNKPVSFGFDDYHHLFAGATKSGKSTAIQSTLCGLVNEYSPDDIELVICDPHNDYQAFGRVPHLGIPVATDRHGIVNAITYVHNLYRIREENNARSAKKLVFVVDEAQNEICLGNKEAGLNTNEVGRLSSLARGAGKFGVHLVIGSQKPTQEDMPGVLDNLTGRYVGRVAKSQISNHLTGQSGLEAHKLSGYGDFLKVTNFDIIRFQTAMPRQADFDSLPRAESAPSALMEVEPIDDSFEQESDSSKPGPDAACLDDPDIIGYYLARAGLNSLPGRVVAGREIGVTPHMHGRYIQLIQEVIRRAQYHRRRLLDE